MTAPGAERMTPPREIYNWHIYFASIAAGFGGALFGYDNAFLGGTLALPSFISQFGLKDLSQHDINNLSSNIIITFQAGCSVACFLALPGAETLGRRMSMIIASIIFIVGAALQLTGHIETFYIGRFLTGIGVGPLTVIAPLYISEVAPSSLRGRCIGVFEICYQMGALVGFWVNYGVSLHVSGTGAAQWRIPVGLQLPLIVVFLVGIVALPETPRFLMKAGKGNMAESVLARLRNLDPDHEYLRQEILDIRDEISIERRLMGITEEDTAWSNLKKQIKECMKPNIAYRVSIGVVTQLFGQLSGINGFNYYSPRIFRSLGVVGTNTGLFATGIFGVVKTITALVSLIFLVDFLGRKTLLLSGSIIMTISNFFLGAYIKIAKPSGTGTGQIDGAGIAACAFIYIYVIGFVSSFAGVPFILASECAPISVRALSATLGAATQWIMNLVVTKATPYMMTDLGYGTFFFFGSCIFLGGFYVWLFVPETKGVSLEHMAAVFGHEDLVFEQQHNAKIEEAAAVEQVDQAMK
ncbi:MFS quinate transporter QutD [Fusarium sp. Ph1]|nr:MFS quinate transporter QutD [Fusarium sp. Ph1]